MTAVDGAALSIEEFTDPGCPFAFSAEPARWRIEWLYGDQIDWSRRMVVLSESPEDYSERGLTPDKQAANLRRLRREHGMPIDGRERPRMVGDRLASTGDDDGQRYTCPSYQFRAADGQCFDIPGFRPVEAYEVAIANLAPRLERRDWPAEVDEVLAWAGAPLATVEVATVCGLEIEEAREELARVADHQPVGNDGYWTLRAAPPPGA